MSAQADYPMPHNWSANTAEDALDEIDRLRAERDTLTAENIDMARYCRDIRETALEIGGIDHTTDAPTMLRELAAQRDSLRAAVAR